MAWSYRLYGQDSVFQSIRESFHDLPHIFITGPPGSGKTTFLEDLMDLMKKQAPFKIESILWLTSEKVAQDAWDSAQAGKAICIPGRQYQVISKLARYAPRSWVRKLGMNLGSRRGRNK